MAEMRILLINGPNLNTLGTRETEIYGTTTLADIERMVTDRAAAAGADVRAFQANGEGEIIDWLQRERRRRRADHQRRAYTHTSVALRDAVAGCRAAGGRGAHLEHLEARGVPPRIAACRRSASAASSGSASQGYLLAVEALCGILKGTE